MCPTVSEPHGSNSVKLSRAQQQWLDGLKAGDGLTSPLSRLTPVGERPALLPIVVSLSPGDGLRRFLTVLATSYALKEDDTGELMLMLSWDLERGVLRSLVETSPRDGNAGEIGFEILMPVPESTAISASTLPGIPTSGISGVPCDYCRRPFKPREAYVQFVVPEVNEMRLWHGRCAIKGGLGVKPPLDSLVMQKP